MHAAQPAGEQRHGHGHGGHGHGGDEQRLLDVGQRKAAGEADQQRRREHLYATVQHEEPEHVAAVAGIAAQDGEARSSGLPLRWAGSSAMSSPATSSPAPGLSER